MNKARQKSALPIIESDIKKKSKEKYHSHHNKTDDDQRKTHKKKEICKQHSLHKTLISIYGEQSSGKQAEKSILIRNKSGKTRSVSAHARSKRANFYEYSESGESQEESRSHSLSRQQRKKNHRIRTAEHVMQNTVKDEHRVPDTTMCKNHCKHLGLLRMYERQNRQLKERLHQLNEIRLMRSDFPTTHDLCEAIRRVQINSFNHCLSFDNLSPDRDIFKKKPGRDPREGAQAKYNDISDGSEEDVLRPPIEIPQLDMSDIHDGTASEEDKNSDLKVEENKVENHKDDGSLQDAITYLSGSLLSTYFRFECLHSIK